MALDFYLLADTFLEAEHHRYLEYFQLEQPPCIDSVELREYAFLDPWIRRCEAERLGVTHFFADTLLLSTAVPRAIALLEQVYGPMTGRTLFGPDPVSPNNPFRHMHAILCQSYPGYGILALCD
ncbi:MAG TPA: hypothetical protein VD886_23155 [Herpetosiphonaceae bacterium]|nr:hypothetical protein [Herpetosiphonaceae bacterium]